MDASCGLMVEKLQEQAIISEFDSHNVTFISGLVPNQNKISK